MRDPQASIIDQLKSILAGRTVPGYAPDAIAELSDLIGDVITMTVESAEKNGYAKGYTAGYEAGVDAGWEQGMNQMRLYGDCGDHGGM